MNVDGRLLCSRPFSQCLPSICRTPWAFLCFMGYGLLGLWMGDIGVAGLLSDERGASCFDLAVLVCETAGLVALSIWSRRDGSLRSSKAMRVCAMALCFIAPIARFIVEGMFAGSWMGIISEVICGAVCGMARALVFLVWVDAFSLLGPRSLYVCFSLASFIRIILATIAGYFAWTPFSCILACVSGVLSLFACYSCARFDALAAVEDGSASQFQVRFPWRPIVLMLVYYPAFCLVLTTVGETGPTQRVGGALVYLGAAIFAFVAFRRFKLSFLYGVALPCMCAALLGAMSVSLLPSWLVLLLAGVGFHSLYLFTYLMLFTIAFRYGVSTIWLVGLTTVPRVLAKGIVGVLATMPGLLSEGASDNVAAVLLIALVVASILLAFGQEYGSTWGVVGEEDDGNCQSHQVSMQDLCRDLSRLYGLTRREEDILVMLAENQAVAEIGERLVLSKGTVRNHVQHIYRKFGVHSREELNGQLAKAREDYGN